MENSSIEHAYHGDNSCGFDYYFFQIHFIAGIGDLVSQLSLPVRMKGHIEDVAASPNDPLFIVHHTAIDCVLEEWLSDHPNTKYPVAPQVRDGHRRDDYSRGFFPLYTNGELFTSTKDFGYSCQLGDVPAGVASLISSPLLMLVTVLTAIVATSNF